jgi:hypothetical protein
MGSKQLNWEIEILRRNFDACDFLQVKQSLRIWKRTDIGRICCFFSHHKYLWLVSRFSRFFRSANKPSGS